MGQKNMTLYELHGDMKLSTHATANFMRRQLATALRKGPYQTNILLGGYDVNAGSSLYFIDMYSALTPVDFGAHGYASNFCLSIFDREWKEGMSEVRGAWCDTGLVLLPTITPCDAAHTRPKLGR